MDKSNYIDALLHSHVYANGVAHRLRDFLSLIQTANHQAVDAVFAGVLRPTKRYDGVLYRHAIPFEIIEELYRSRENYGKFSVALARALVDGAPENTMLESKRHLQNSLDCAFHADKLLLWTFNKFLTNYMVEFRSRHVSKVAIESLMRPVVDLQKRINDEVHLMRELDPADGDAIRARGLQCDKGFESLRVAFFSLATTSRELAAKMQEEIGSASHIYIWMTILLLVFLTTVIGLMPDWPRLLGK